MVWDCKRRKTAWMLHPKFSVKLQNSCRITLDITQSEKQKPACAQQLALFLRGCDISDGRCPRHQHTKSPAPFPPSPLTCQQAAPGPADAVPPPFPTATEERYYKSTSRRVIPGLTWTGTAHHGKRDSSRYMGTCQQSCSALSLPQTHPAATLRPRTLRATHLRQPTKRERPARGLQTRLRDLFLAPG